MDVNSFYDSKKRSSNTMDFLLISTFILIGITLSIIGLYSQQDDPMDFLGKCFVNSKDVNTIARVTHLERQIFDEPIVVHYEVIEDFSDDFHEYTPIYTKKRQLRVKDKNDAEYAFSELYPLDNEIDCIDYLHQRLRLKIKQLKSHTGSK